MKRIIQKKVAVWISDYPSKDKVSTGECFYIHLDRSRFRILKKEKKISSSVMM